MDTALLSEVHVIEGLHDILGAGSTYFLSFTRTLVVMVESEPEYVSLTCQMNPLSTYSSAYFL